FAPLGWMPRHLHAAKYSLGMRHEDGKPAIRGGEARNSPRRAVGIVRIALADLAAVVDEAQRHQRLRRSELLLVVELGITLAVRRRDRDARALHAEKEQRRRALDPEQNQPRFELLGLVAHEMRPVRRAGNELMQIAHHLAAIANAQREGVWPREKRRE